MDRQGETACVFTLLGDTAGFLPPAEHENPEGVCVGEDGQVNAHPEVVGVAQVFPDSRRDCVIVRDGGVDDVPG